MDQVKVDVQALHQEHNLWMNELAFYAQEISLFEKALGKLVQKEVSRDDLAVLEQLQNQFIRQREVLDELKHGIHLHEQAMGNFLKGNEEATTYWDHDKMREGMERFRKIYTEIKSHFTSFVSKWL